MANPRTIAKLESRILERAAECLQFEIRDPRASFVTVTRVELSPDLSFGKIYYSVLGSEGDKSKAEHMLESAAGFIQRRIAPALAVRRMPHLRWVYDASLEKADEIGKLIREAREHDRAINPKVDEAPEPVGDQEPEPIGDQEPDPVGDDDEDGDGQDDGEDDAS